MTTKVRSLFDTTIMRRALIDPIYKLDPRREIRNPVMFTVYVGSILTTALWIMSLNSTGEEPSWFIFAISIWLWFTVLFANFAEAMAEGRGKAQADSLRRPPGSSGQEILEPEIIPTPRRCSPNCCAPARPPSFRPPICARATWCSLKPATTFRPTAKSSKARLGRRKRDHRRKRRAIRESGGDRSGVTGGTRVLSDWLIVRIMANPGETFLDRMIAMVEGAKPQKTPNEIALDILLAGMTIIFLLVCVTLLPYSFFSVGIAGQGTPITVTVLVALLVCLIPTTIGALLSAIGIAGMDRMIQANVIAMSGRAVEAAGDVDVLLLDKTGTITLGNRQAVEFITVDGIAPADLASAGNYLRWPMKRPRAAASSCWPKRSTACATRHQPDSCQVHSLQRAHPHQRGEHGRAEIRRERPTQSRTSSSRRAARFPPMSNARSN